MQKEYKLIVGLGNFDKEYGLTRHNTGFLVVDHLVSKLNNSPEFKIAEKMQCEFLSFSVAALEEKPPFIHEIDKWFGINHVNLIFIKPRTYMNNSGRAVSFVKNFYQIPNKNILVIHDDLDYKLGQYRVLFGKGPRIHNGVNSVEEFIGKDFWRVRVGIDNREPDNRIPGGDFVLQKFSPEELKIIQNL